MYGDKVKFFRKLKNISQLELELVTNLSEGSISRIENNMTNPTKETLLKIADSLKLTVAESNYLVNLNYFESSIDENERVIHLYEKRFSSITTFAYILDPKDRLIFSSKGLNLLGKVTGIDMKKTYGINIYKVLVDPSFGIRQTFTETEILTALENSLNLDLTEKRFVVIEEWFKKLISELYRYPEFKSSWTKVAKLKKLNDVYQTQNRYVTFNIAQMKIKFLYHISPVVSDPRFTVIEYEAGSLSSVVHNLISKLKS